MLSIRAIILPKYGELMCANIVNIQDILCGAVVSRDGRLSNHGNEYILFYRPRSITILCKTDET
jgi:hypothetical protein